VKNDFLNMDIVLITEANFIIDTVLEQSDECERLLDFVRKQDIRLVIPEYAFAETEGTIITIIHNRLSSIDVAINALRQSARSAYYFLDELIIQLQQYKENTERVELPMLHTKMKNLEEIASIVPFTSESMVRAELRELRQIAPFKQTDRNIYESIFIFAKTNQNPKMKMLFLTRDRSDFDFPYIKEELASVNIELFFSAGECIRRIREILDAE
jgi:hypothetical protein